MNRYESYQNSGIDWVGEIPSHWEIIKPKHKLKRVTRPVDNEDDVVTCFRDGVVTLRKNRREDGFTNSIKEHGYQQIRPGDLVVHEMDGFEGAIGISDSKGKSTPVYTVIEPDHRVDLLYVAYLLREMSESGKVESLARSIRERTTDFRWNMWSVIHFPFPPIEEQKLISQYLEKKTKQIDKLTNKIQKKIELLKEQQTSFINQCTTKGLNQNVEMKDSGVEWIGLIPKHWSLRKLNHFYTYKKGSMGQKLTSSYLEENSGEYPVYSGQTSNNGILGTWSDYEFDFNTEVIFCTTVGARLMTTQVLSGKFSLSQNCLIMIPKDISILSKYINYFLLYDFRIRRELLPSILQPSLRMEDLDQYQILIPPVEEQIKIVDLVSQHMILSENVISKLMTKILLLKEYRKSLISYVVTGKVRVTKDMI